MIPILYALWFLLNFPLLKENETPVSAKIVLAHQAPV